MVGRCYRWDGRVWRVIARWQDVPQSHGVVAPGATFVCESCGAINPPCGSDLLCTCGGQRRARRGAPRNVLIEDVETGHRTVRPFRGLRRVNA